MTARALLGSTAAILLLSACGSSEVAAAKPTPEQLDASIQLAKCTFNDMLAQMDGIPTVSAQDAADICTDMSRRFGSPPQLRVIRKLGRAASLIAITGNQSSDAINIVAAQLNDVAVARGQTDPDKIMGTYDVVFGAWEATDGRVSPREITKFLKAAGPMAHTLSDDGLVNMIAVIDRS